MFVQTMIYSFLVGACFESCYAHTYGCKRHSRYRWLNARLPYLQRVSNGDTAVLHKAIDIIFRNTSHRQVLNASHFTHSC